MKWHKGDDAVVRGRAKARSVDPHVKQWIVEASLRSGEQPTALLATRSCSAGSASAGVQWVQEQMAAFQAAVRLSFAQVPGSLSLAMDAARIGKPGLEILLIAASDLSSQRHCVLPPPGFQSSPGLEQHIY